MIVQVTEISKDDTTEISILKKIVDLYGIQCGTNGTFNGQIRVLNQNSKILPLITLEFVELLVKQTYFSRRDQYKVHEALRKTSTHVYQKKMLFFDQLSLEVTCMLQNNDTVRKTGIVDKNTKLLFRTNCSKLTLALQISIETFHLNQNKELYLEKMIQFLCIFFHRNNAFQNAHKLTILLFGRLFYPQFKTLNEAYNYLLKENSIGSLDQKFSINFSVALQKDHRGRIFQDVYRRTIWSKSDNPDSFRKYLWQKVSQFVFTMNPNSNNASEINKFIFESQESKLIEPYVPTRKVSINSQKQKQDSFISNDIKVKPFLHKLKGTLSNSKNSNLFQTICLTSQQYKHHYRFRSLVETGNTILILSAGKSEYQVDDLTYKMAKSYINLTNVYCSFINFNHKSCEKLVVQTALINKPLFGEKDRQKLLKSDFNCVEKQVYHSPVNQDIEIKSSFSNRNMIFSDQFEKVTPEEDEKLRKIHYCEVIGHYKLLQEHQIIEEDPHFSRKEVQFIQLYLISDDFLHVHEYIYSNLFKFSSHKYSSKNKNLSNLSELDIFQGDLQKIISRKSEWSTIENQENQIELQIQNFSYKYLANKNKLSHNELSLRIQNLNKTLFKQQVEQVEQKQCEFDFHETKSNDQFKGKFMHSGNLTRNRKISETLEFDMINTEKTIPLASQDQKGKINIFEVTFKNKNHQYNAKNRNMKSMKKKTSHYKERNRNNHLDCTIHYLMGSFNDLTLKKFKSFINKEYIEQHKNDEEHITLMFQMQKAWKNLCFPLLVPIYTKYKQNYKQQERHLDAGLYNELYHKKFSAFEEETANLLSKNYQLHEQTHLNLSKLSKGHVSCHLTLNDQNIAREFIIDKKYQNNVTHYMLYRYLCYEDKDYRFSSKYIYFQDKNYFTPLKSQNKEEKVVRIVYAHDDGTTVTLQDMIANFSLNLTQVSNFDRDSKQQKVSSSFSEIKKQIFKDPLQDFSKMFNDFIQQYDEDFKIEMVAGKPQIKPAKVKQIIIFSNKQRNFYHHQEIQIEIDKEYNLRNLFEIKITWTFCMSVLVNNFVETLLTLGRRSKLKSYMIPGENLFESHWSMTTLGQIIFEKDVGIQLLENSICKKGEWLWDSYGYFMNKSGIAYIKFKKQKRLVLWRDNMNERRIRNVTNDQSSKKYFEFFMIAAAYDFLGSMITNAVQKAEQI